MCVIINNEKGKVIEDEWLVEAVTRNPHGGGIYDCDTGAIIRTMNMDKMLNEMRSRSRWVAHCRYATVGPKTVPNCHPYNIIDDWYLMMNGTVKVNTPKGWSDTRAVAALLSKLPPKTWAHVLKVFPARFLFWKVGFPCEMTGHGWHSHDGVRYSKKLGARRLNVRTYFKSLKDLEPDENATSRFERLADFEREMLEETETQQRRIWNAY